MPSTGCDKFNFIASNEGLQRRLELSLHLIYATNALSNPGTQLKLYKQLVARS